MILLELVGVWLVVSGSRECKMLSINSLTPPIVLHPIDLG